MSNLLLLGEALPNKMQEFTSAIMTSVTSEINLTVIAAVIAAIIGAGIVGNFGWKFARKGYHFVVNTLSGKAGKI